MIRCYKGYKMDQLYISIITAIVIVVVTVLLINRHAVFTQQQKSFLIVGPSFSGKTSLFQILTTQQVPKFPPVLSQQVSEIKDYELSAEGVGDKFLMRDYPGHAKLLNLYLYKDLKDESFVKNIKGIIIVIDSSNIDLLEITKMLYEILTYTESLPNGVDILMACNKQDLFQSKPVFKIREILELEMNKLRINNLKNLNKIGSNDDDDLELDNFNLLNSNDVFTFDKLQGNFDFIEGSVLKKKIDEWECWIAERGVN